MKTLLIIAILFTCGVVNAQEYTPSKSTRAAQTAQDYGSSYQQGYSDRYNNTQGTIQPIAPITPIPPVMAPNTNYSNAGYQQGIIDANKAQEQSTSVPVYKLPELPKLPRY